MDFICYSFRHAITLFENSPAHIPLWNEIKMTISEISDDDIIKSFNSSSRDGKKSISDDINNLIDFRLCGLGWNCQSPIFSDPTYAEAQDRRRWTLDFAKDEISIEVAFNHGEATAWNLIKPVLASELNHVEKAVQTSAGVIITATNAMKKAGNFDGAVGTYEKYVKCVFRFIRTGIPIGMRTVFRKHTDTIPKVFGHPPPVYINHSRS
jgi:hypothetical protein